MPWSGTSFNRSDGTRSGTNVWTQARDAAVNILAADHDTHDQDLADGLEECLKKDGNNAATGNIPMGSNKFTNLGSGNARTDSVNFGQIQDGAISYGGTSSGTDTITFTLSPALTAYAAGQRFTFLAGGTNTGATTLNINSLGAKAIQKLGAALVAGDITANDIVEVEYDGTQFQMLSPARTPALTAGGIATAALADSAVTTAKINDAAVTTAKINDAAVTTAKINDDAVTLAKLAAGTDGELITWDASGNPAAVAVGTSGHVLTSNGAGAAPTFQQSSGLTLLTPQTTTSGTFKDFTIPSGAQLVLVSFRGVSVSGTSNPAIQLGDSGGVEASNYLGATSQIGSTVQTGNHSTAFRFLSALAANVMYGNVTLTLENASDNTWSCSGSIGLSSSADQFLISGSKSLSAELTTVRITTVGGANTFDAGELNVSWM